MNTDDISMSLVWLFDVLQAVQNPKIHEKMSGKYMVRHTTPLPPPPYCMDAKYCIQHIIYTNIACVACVWCVYVSVLIRCARDMFTLSFIESFN